MEIIKQYKTVIFVVTPILIFVLIRAFGSDHFMTDAKKLAGPSFSRSNIIVFDKASQLPGEKLLINLEKNVIKHNLSETTVKKISPDSILYKENIRLLRRHKGPVILISSEIAVSVRIWMILSQMGVENLFVFSDDPDPEVLKYEFRPDTMVRPEL